MKILVTGGAGFIGSNIVDAYIIDGHRVTVVDDLSTGNESNINKKAEFIKLDIRSPRIEELFKKSKFDVVNHQAARGNVRVSVEIPMEYADVNVRGGINLLECSRKFGVKKFIYSSTGGCVYGKLLKIPADENHPIGPVEPYGASKAAFEFYLSAYAAMYGLNFTTFRYPNVYGPRQDPFGEAGVISIFIGQMLSNEQTIINGDGEQTRDYVFVNDVVRANQIVLENGNNNIFNLGTGRETSVNTIFRELKKILDYEKPEKHGPAKLGEVPRSCLDSKRAMKLLGWKADILIEDGLKQTADFFRQKEVLKRYKKCL